MRPLALIPVAAFALLACEQLLGIEDAHYDESLEETPKAGSGEGGSESMSDPDPCEEYCATVMSHCQGEQAQYADEQSCLDVCSRLPVGSATAAKENSVSCRLHQAELAQIEPLVHCSLAGPGGNGECGGNCDGFCAVMMTTCTAEDTEHHYADLEACLLDCQGVPDEGEYSTGSSEGNSVQCRLYHAVAATQDADRHCPHALGNSPCK